MTGPAEKQNRLFEIASSQFGLFTAKQAVESGYDRKHFHEHVKNSVWEKEFWGLFRLRNYPSSPEQEYMKWLLWSRNRAGEIQGCLSYETALYIYKLGGAMPSQIHLTVPKDFRRSGSAPKIVQLHSENLGRKAVQVESGLTLTTPVKTLEDLIKDGRTDKDILEESLSKALEIGMITRKDVNQNDFLRPLIT